MPTERWRRIDRIFTEALEQPAGTRAEFLARACGPDVELRREIASLLGAAEQSQEFLTEPALEVFARQVAREGFNLKSGDRLGSYTIDRRVGAGGMGEVWLARDERLSRDVAIKVLLPHAADSAERLRAFEYEARAAGTLNHENVVTVYDVGEHDGIPYLVTEYLDGESLRARLQVGPLALDAALDVAIAVARGLGAAHERGTVHRDLKPENVFLTRDGRVKILDFGLAMPSLRAGTLGYMAPEQSDAETVDARADVYALGVMLHEMLSGRRPDDVAGQLAAPAALSAVVRRCLAPSREQRFSSAAELVSALEAIRDGRRGFASRLLTFARRPVVMAGAVLALGALVGVALHWRASSQASWARSVAGPEIQRLMDRGEVARAYLLARRVLTVAPEDPLLLRLWNDVSVPAPVTTEPVGAEIEVGPYQKPENSWISLGRTPLPEARIPRGLFRVRIQKEGFQTIEGTGSPGALPAYRLDAVGAAPPGMVRAVGGSAPARFGLKATLDDFWIDRFEVSNREFKAFVDAGGYTRPELWREPFLERGKPLTFHEAMLRFRDGSGQPGPATWNSGTYPDGQASYPVGGVSWYEAMAYAAFVGKSLPTLYHWYYAATLARFADILESSNFGGKGPAAVGHHAGLGPFGTYDMAGNVREWGLNELDGRRFSLGGAWNDSPRMFNNADAKDAFERAPSYGFRLAKYTGHLSATLSAPVRLDTLGRDVRKTEPVNDGIFDVYRRQFAYDRGPLNVSVEEVTAMDGYQRLGVVFDAAYAGERLRAFLFLPSNAAPPYQTVVFFPPGDVFVVRSSRELSLAWGEPIVRSGRAFVYPVYKGTYERRTPSLKVGANEARELRIAWSRDLGRTIDYLATRSDLDLTRLTFYAVGAGPSSVVLTALEPRVKFAVLQGAGIALWGDFGPEIDAIHYAPRVRVPTLMLSTRYDFNYPVETSQRPLFELLGSPAGQKQHVVLEMGHGLPIAVGAREILPWLERNLGPVAEPSREGRGVQTAR